MTIRNQFGGKIQNQINLAVVSNFTATEILLIDRLTNYQIIVLLENSHHEQHTLTLFYLSKRHFTGYCTTLKLSYQISTLKLHR